MFCVRYVYVRVLERERERKKRSIINFTVISLHPLFDKLAHLSATKSVPLAG